MTFSCYQRQHLFREEALCKLFVTHLDRARERRHFQLWAYVVMPNHVHLLVRPADGDRIGSLLLSVKKGFSVEAVRWIASRNSGEMMKVVKPGQQVARATQAANRFWQAGGGYDRNIFKEDAMVKAMEYIHYNPVRLKLVEKPVDWRWSSARFWELREAEPIRMDVPDWWKGR